MEFLWKIFRTLHKIYLFPRDLTLRYLSPDNCPQTPPETPWILPTQFFVGKVCELGMRANLSLVDNCGQKQSTITQSTITQSKIVSGGKCRIRRNGIISADLKSCTIQLTLLLAQSWLLIS